MDSRPARSHFVEERRVGARSENLLVHGDNLPTLRALARSHAGKVRCAYLDPPFNTGRSFAEYKDARSAADWARTTREQIEALAPLIAEDGAVFVEIDDTSLAALSVILDDVFGPSNRVSTITIVRSAATGHKAINRAPVHVSDFLLAYAKDKKEWRYRPQFRVRARFDAAYTSWLDDPDAPHRQWTFRPLTHAFAAELGHRRDAHGHFRAMKELGKDVFRARLEAFALTHARHVTRLAQPRFEAIAKAAQRIVERSRADPERASSSTSGPDFGRSSCAAEIASSFSPTKCGSSTASHGSSSRSRTCGTTCPFKGLRVKEAWSSRATRSPEQLIARVLEMSTDRGDWVLDPFLGSGTTAAVAHKMGRRWIGIEAGDHARTLAEPRLRRVVEGSDPTGVTSVYRFAGGGGFRVATLA